MEHLHAAGEIEALRLGLLAAALLSSCASVLPPSDFAAGEPKMRLEVVFDGETRSTGILEAASDAPSQRFHVEGRGRRLADGRLELLQTVTLDGKAPSTRTWVMTLQGSHDYAATLTDAAGSVRAQAYGDLLHLRYPLKGMPSARWSSGSTCSPTGAPWSTRPWSGSRACPFGGCQNASHTKVGEAPLLSGIGLVLPQTIALEIAGVPAAQA